MALWTGRDWSGGLPLALAERRVDAHAIRHNIKQIEKRIGSRSIIAMVKADGYGHGAIPLCRLLANAGVHRVGVAHVSEALALRQSGFAGSIWVLQPDHRLAPQTFLDQNLEATFQGPEDLAAFQESNLAFHVMLDSGMGREGLSGNDFQQLLPQLVLGIERIRAFATHFACSDEANPQRTMTQFQTFQNLVAPTLDSLTDQTRPMLHLANSGAIVNFPQTFGDAVRPGILLYGQYQGHGDFDQQPALSLWAPLVQIKKVPAGQPIGYGATYHTPSETSIGILNVGYGDGYLRTFPLTRTVSFEGRTFPVIGRVSMDQITVDLGHQPPPVGSWFEVLSPQQISQEAQILGTISYERCCQLGLRAQLRWIGA
ncbi:MAG: alanine racemase [Acidobacteria bacterium]|nr:alanine racemase [Acidobacteriota bacterium]